MKNSNGTSGGNRISSPPPLRSGNRLENRTRRAHTLVELLIVCGLTVLLLACLYLMWYGATRYSVEQEERVSLMREAQIGMAHLVRELQQSRRILYPAPGDKARSGIVFVTGEGDPVLIMVEAPAGGLDPGASGKILRVDLATEQRRVLARHVRDFQCRVPAVPSGRDPALVLMALTVSGPRGKSLYFMTGAHLAAPDIRCPVDRPAETLWAAP